MFTQNRLVRCVTANFIPFFLQFCNSSFNHLSSLLALENNTSGHISFLSSGNCPTFLVLLSLEVMGSRRMTRSSFSNGRSSSGEDNNGMSWPSGCSYISNVRPENRYSLSEGTAYCSAALDGLIRACYLFGSSSWSPAVK